MSPRPVIGQADGEGIPLKSTNWEKGGVTFASPTNIAPNSESGDGSYELEILKCILLREGYLHRISDICKRENTLEPKQMFGRLIDLLDLLRQSSVETVEAISTWKHSFDRPKSFLWNGINYLLKMPSDTSYLDKYEPLRKWLGFSLSRNPFIMPVRLDKRVKTPKRRTPAQRLRDGKRTINTDEMDAELRDVGLSSVLEMYGGQHEERGGDLHSKKDSFLEIGTGALHIEMSRKAKNLLPGGTKLSDHSRIGDPYKSKHTKSSRGSIIAANASTITMKMMPTQIGDFDLERIRYCEKVILAEESTHGRYVLNKYGKYVPEVLETRREAVGLGFGASTMLNGDDARNAALKAMSEFTIDTANNNNNNKNIDDNHKTKSINIKSTQAGRRRAQKEGGLLFPLASKQSIGRQQKPNSHSRPARQDAEIRRMSNDISEMANNLRMMQYDIEKEEKEIKATEASLIASSQESGDIDNTEKINTSQLQNSMSTLRGGSDHRRFHRRIQELTVRKKEYQRHKLELKERQRKLNKAKELRHSQRSKEKKHQDEVHAKKIENKKLEGEEMETTVIEDYTMDEKAAIILQRIARGKLSKLFTNRRRIQFNRCALFIQQGFRAKNARKSLATNKVERIAATKVQRTIRGFLDRIVTRKMRDSRRKENAATLMQNSFRFSQGKKRTNLRRKLVEAKKAAVRVTEVILPFDLNELLDIKPPAPVPVLHLMRSVMMLMSIPTKKDIEDVVNIEKKKKKKRIKSSEKSTGLQVRELSWGKCVNFGKKEYFIESLRSMAVDAYQETLLLSSAMIRQVSIYFLDPKFTPVEISKIESGGYAARLLLVWVQSLVTVHNMLNHFTSWENRRPSKCLYILHNNSTNVEGKESNDEENEQVVLKKKYLSSNRYVPDFAIPHPIARPRPVIVAAARETPTQCKELLLANLLTALPGTFVRIDVVPINVGVVQNAFDVGNSVVLDVHIGQGAAARKAFIEQFQTLRDTLHPRPMCILLQGHRLNRNGGSDATLGVAPELQNRMPDYTIKKLLERAAESLYCLGRDGNYEILKNLSGMQRPPNVGTVLLMEALIILFSPHHGFKSPNRSVSMVTWPASQKLLAFPEQLFRRLRECEIDSIPQRNLRVLRQYISHSRWPTRDDVYAGDLGPIARLLDWVETVIKYAGALEGEGGKAPKILKGDGLFSSTVVVTDEMPNNRLFTALLWPVLRDLKVYAQARKIQQRHTVCSVFFESKTLFFFVYVPELGHRYHTSLPVAWIEGSLAPNSVETLSDPRPAPETTVQLYQRLAELLRFDRFTGKLLISRKLARLKRESIRIGRHLITLTVSELSFGHLVIQGYEPETSKLFSLNIGPEECEQIEADADEYELKEIQSKDSRKIMHCLMDRLYFRRGRLRIRYNGGSGKKIFEKGIQVNNNTVICTIFASHWGLRIKTYLPHTSDTYVFRLSTREQLELLGTISQSQQSIWVRKLIGLIQIKGGEIMMNRRLYSEVVKVNSTYLTIEAHVLGFDGGLTISCYKNDNSGKFVLPIVDSDIIELVQSKVEVTDGKDIWPRPDDRLARDKVIRALFHSVQWQLMDYSVVPPVDIEEGHILMLGKDPQNPISSAREEIQFEDVAGLSIADTITRGKRSKSRRSSPRLKSKSPRLKLKSPRLKSKSPRLKSKQQMKEIEQEIEKPNENDTSTVDNMKTNVKYKNKELALREEEKKLAKLGVDASRHGRLLIAKVTRKGGRLLTLSVYDDESKFKTDIRIVAYDASLSVGAVCYLKWDEVELAVGQRFDLLSSEKRIEMAKYLVNERVRVLPIAVAQEEDIGKLRIGKHVHDNDFVIRISECRRYTHDRVTPLRSVLKNLLKPSESLILDRRFPTAIKLSSRSLKVEAVSTDKKTLRKKIIFITSFYSITDFYIRLLVYDPNVSRKADLLLNKKELLKECKSNNIVVPKTSEGDELTLTVVHSLLDALFPRVKLIINQNMIDNLENIHDDDDVAYMKIVLKEKISKSELAVLKAQSLPRKEILQVGITVPIDGQYLPVIAQIEEEIVHKNGENVDDENKVGKIFITLYEPATSATSELLLEPDAYHALLSCEALSHYKPISLPTDSLVDGDDTKYLYILSELKLTRNPQFTLSLSKVAQTCISLRQTFDSVKTAAITTNNENNDKKKDVINIGEFRQLVHKMKWDISVEECIELLSKADLINTEVDELTFTFANFEFISQERIEYRAERMEMEVAMTKRRKSVAEPPYSELPDKPGWLAPRFFLRLDQSSLRKGCKSFRDEEALVLLQGTINDSNILHSEDSKTIDNLCVCGITKENVRENEHFWHAILSTGKHYFLSEYAFEDRFVDSSEKLLKEHFVLCNLEEVKKYATTVKSSKSDNKNEYRCRITGTDLCDWNECNTIYHAFMAGDRSYLLCKRAFEEKFFEEK
eukprot:GSMAST32.ASY1.ANO1.2800.1 assembled CDS